MDEPYVEAPAEVRGALYIDYSFILPAARAALAHAAAGGNAHLLSVGPVEGAHAVHGTEMYGIVGQQRPQQSNEQAIRDTFVCDALLDFTAGNHDRLWKAVTTEPISHAPNPTKPMIVPTSARQGSCRLSHAAIC